VVVSAPPALRARTVDDLLAAGPDTAAVRDATGAWSRAELDAAAWAAAAWLAGRGVRPGDRVACRLGNTREFVALLFGTLRLGAVFVPLNPEMKPYQLAQVLADAEPALLVTGQPDDGAAAPGVPVGALAELRAGLAVPAGAHPVSRADPDRLALLIYTSGSTSAPKAVMCPHRAVVFAAGAIVERLGYRPDDVVLTAIPLSFDYGLYQIFLSLLAGATLVLAEPAANIRLPGTLRRHRVTVLPVVPSLAGMLIRLAGRDAGTPPPVRLVTNTGAALTGPLIAGLRRALPGVTVVPMFGITECKRISIVAGDAADEPPGALGRPLSGTTVEILDEDGRPVDAGEVGEITVRGPHVMAGYWRAPELTARRYRPGPAGVTLHTGDYGWLDTTGRLYFQGRRDDIFKRHGLRVSTLEVEAAAMDVPGVRAAAVLPPTDARDAVLFAVSDRSPEHILHQLRQHLEDGKVPSICRLVDRLPLTANGKTDKRRLAASLDAPDAPGRPGTAARPT
jgi:amino acid adenylation domain-containing protein